MIKLNKTIFSHRYQHFSSYSLELIKSYCKCIICSMDDIGWKIIFQQVSLGLNALILICTWMAFSVLFDFSGSGFLQKTPERIHSQMQYVSNNLFRQSVSHLLLSAGGVDVKIKVLRDLKQVGHLLSIHQVL